MGVRRDAQGAVQDHDARVGEEAGPDADGGYRLRRQGGALAERRYRGLAVVVVEAGEVQQADCARGRRLQARIVVSHPAPPGRRPARSEEHTFELKSRMRISYAVFCVKKKNTTPYTTRY